MKDDSSIRETVAPAAVVLAASAARIMHMSAARARQLADAGIVRATRSADGVRLFEVASCETYARQRAEKARMK